MGGSGFYSDPRDLVANVTTCNSHALSARKGILPSLALCIPSRPRANKRIFRSANVLKPHLGINVETLSAKGVSQHETPRTLFRGHFIALRCRHRYAFLTGGNARVIYQDLVERFGFEHRYNGRVGRLRGARQSESRVDSPRSLRS